MPTIARRLVQAAVFALGTLPLSADASHVVVTITGIVSAGNDTTGVFGTERATPNLAGRPVTLIFTFDDTRGLQGVQKCNSVPCESWDCSNLVCGDFADPKVSNPGTAVLQIGSGAFAFGELPATAAASLIRRLIPPATVDGAVYLRVSESYSGVRYRDGSYDVGNSFVQATILPASYPRPGGEPLTTAYEWWAPLEDSNLYNYPLTFGIYRTHSGTPQPVQQANGTIVPHRIVVSSY